MKACWETQKPIRPDMKSSSQSRFRRAAGRCAEPRAIGSRTVAVTLRPGECSLKATYVLPLAVESRTEGVAVSADSKIPAFVRRSASVTDGPGDRHVDDLLYVECNSNNPVIPGMDGSARAESRFSIFNKSLCGEHRLHRGETRRIGESIEHPASAGHRDKYISKPLQDKGYQVCPDDSR